MMTTQEIIAIIGQNKDLLTAENYQRILTNVGILSADDKRKIAKILISGRSVIESKKHSLRQQNQLYRETAGELQNIETGIKDDMKVVKIAEQQRSSAAADRLISNL